MSETFQPSDLSNATPAGLVDQLGAVREKKKALEKEEGFLKTALKARLKEGQTTVEGEVYSALIEQSSRTTLDSAKVKEEQGEEWWAANCKTTTFVVIRTAKR